MELEVRHVIAEGNHILLEKGLKLFFLEIFLATFVFVHHAAEITSLEHIAKPRGVVCNGRTRRGHDIGHYLVKIPFRARIVLFVALLIIIVFLLIALRFINRGLFVVSLFVALVFIRRGLFCNSRSFLFCTTSTLGLVILFPLSLPNGLLFLFG